MLNEKQSENVPWMSTSPMLLPKPQHTREFPSGLITDYIKMVDRMRVTPKKDK